MTRAARAGNGIARTRWYATLFGAGPVLDEDEESGLFHHTVFALAGGMHFIAPGT